MSRFSLGRHLILVLLWSAISAAFIGPGTVTTAAKAGAGYGLTLLWALVFSTLACLTLQEASARVTIATGLPLGRVICSLFGKRRAMPAVVLGAVLLGCAAYEMGNILGAVAGAGLLVGVPRMWLTLGCGLLAGTILWLGSTRGVAKLLGLVVAGMGVVFLISAVKLQPPIADLLNGGFIPVIPPGASLLVLGLVGTTVVPYNLFLGSGLARGQTLYEARIGMAVAIPLGGLISLGIVVVGTTLDGEFTFAALASALSERLGSWSAVLVAIGLFAAGLSSAITAPLAAALAVRGFVSNVSGWNDTAWRYRAVWSAVLLFGLGFGLAGVQPIPAIVLAQAFNGVLLPLVAVVLWTVVNDRNLVGASYLIGGLHNVWLGFCVLVALVLGSTAVLCAVSRALAKAPLSPELQFLVAGSTAVALILPVAQRIRRIRANRNEDSPLPPVESRSD